MSKIKVVLCFLVAACCASATTLTIHMTVDDVFTTYISTSDSVLGTQIGSGNFWPNIITISNSPLTAGVTNYIHVVASNNFGPEMFIGDFSLSDTGFHFTNGTQTLVTNTTNWGVSTTGFGGAYLTPFDEGVQPSGTWGTVSPINSGARFIWGGPVCENCTVYFSAAITPQTVGAVPEPATFGLLGGGLALVLLRRTRRVL